MVKRTTNDIYSLLLDFRTDLLDLRDHVNHRSEVMEERLNQIEEALKVSINNDEILQSIGIALWKDRWVRWGIGVIGFTALSTAATAWWFPILHHAFNTLPF